MCRLVGPAPSMDDGRVLRLNVEGKEVRYRDVPEKSWFAPAVSRMIRAGFSEGYRDRRGRLLGRYGPADPLRGSELMAFIERLTGQTLSIPRRAHLVGRSELIDQFLGALPLPMSQEKALELGITNGERLSNSVNRAEAATIFVRAAEKICPVLREATVKQPQTIRSRRREYNRAGE